MICKSNQFVGDNQQNLDELNWSRRVSYHANQYYSPYGGAAALLNLVYVAANATGAAQHLHTWGSRWAFEDIAGSDSWAVALPDVAAGLDYVVKNGAALTDSWKARQADPTAATQLVHVEAGITIGALTQLLKGNGLAMPTLGGSNGQSLAGAISTSTHGGDWDQPPLPDYVRAIHLVTEAGQELWIERDSDPITTDARLTPVLPCQGATIVRSDSVFNSAVVSFGRFGVIYSLVLEVTRMFRVVEVVTTPTRSSLFQALRTGMASINLFDPMFAVLSQDPVPPGLVEGPALSIPANRPYFWEIVFNSLDQENVWARRRWITSEAADLNLSGGGPPGFLLGALQGIVDAYSQIGLPVPAAAVQAALQLNSLSPGSAKRGEHWLVTSGSVQGSQTIPYRADSIEVIFDATDAAYLDFLNAIQAQGPSFRQAGYISMRPCRSSRATLSMHNVASAHAISIEVASLQGMKDNDAWMQYVEAQAVQRGGRPHWGQINTLNADQTLALYGQGVMNWRNALQQVSGSSTTFSNAFTRQRGLEPAAFQRQITAVSQAANELLVIQIQNQIPLNGDIQYAHWSPTSGGWNAFSTVPHPLGPGSDSPATFFGSAAVDGAAYVFRIGPDGWVYFTSRGQNAQWVPWWVAGRSSEASWNGLPCGAVNAVSCQPGMVHLFYTDKQGRILASRGSTAGATTWPESLRLLAGRTSPGGHVTAVSRRPGQIDVFSVGTDQRVYTAAWNATQGWQGWWPIPGVASTPGTYVSAVSRSLDQLDIFVPDTAGRTMSAAWNPQSGWQGWWHIQNGFTNSGYVTAVSRSTDLLDIFTVGTDQRLWTAAWNPAQGWIGWWQLFPAVAASVSAVWPVSRSKDLLDIFFVDAAGEVQTAGWDKGWGGPWTLH